MQRKMAHGPIVKTIMPAIDLFRFIEILEIGAKRNRIPNNIVPLVDWAIDTVNLGHALYDTEMVGPENSSAGKHPFWAIHCESCLLPSDPDTSQVEQLLPAFRI